MKRHIILAFLLIVTVFVFAQSEKKEIIKKGWNFGPLPVVGFSSDLGFQYGACVDIFNYGDGSRYPNYNYKMNVEVSTYTKGSSTFRFYGDYNDIFPKTKLFVDVAYFIDKEFGFYGFNGYRGVFENDIAVFKNNDSFYVDHNGKSAFNYMCRKQIRAIVSVKRPFPSCSRLFYAFGLGYFNNASDRLDVSGYDDQLSLFELYREANLIKDDEKYGNVTQLKAGLIFDSRDHENDPCSGTYIEAVVTGAPDLIDGHGYDFMTATAVFSQYYSFVKNHFTFAYRLGAQNVIAGKVPFHAMMNTNILFYKKLTTDALGGSNSLRGINPNGVIGKGYAWLNAELRCRIYDFQFVKQNWIIGLNPFFDAGLVTQVFRADEQKQAWQTLCDKYAVSDIDDYIYSGKDESLHTALGCGLKLIMNHNLVVSVDAAKALDKRDGDALKLYVGFNYIF